MNPSTDDHLAAAHEMIDGRDAEIEQLKETIRAFGRGDIVPITDKDAEIERLRNENGELKRRLARYESDKRG